MTTKFRVIFTILAGLLIANQAVAASSDETKIDLTNITASGVNEKATSFVFYTNNNIDSGAVANIESTVSQIANSGSVSFGNNTLKEVVVGVASIRNKSGIREGYNYATILKEINTDFENNSKIVSNMTQNTNLNSKIDDIEFKSQYAGKDLRTSLNDKWWLQNNNLQTGQYSGNIGVTKNALVDFDTDDAGKIQMLGSIDTPKNFTSNGNVGDKLVYFIRSGIGNENSVNIGKDQTSTNWQWGQVKDKLASLLTPIF